MKVRKWKGKKKGKKREYMDMYVDSNATAKDLGYASYGNGYLTQSKSHH